MMLYEKLFDRLEKIRWNLADDVAWSRIDPSLLTPYQIESIANICKTELGSLFAAEAFIRDFYHDIDFSCFVSIWYYEEMKHCLALKKYLNCVGMHIEESDMQQMRMTIPPNDNEAILMIHFLSEHKLAMWYNGIARWLDEPVGKDLFKKIAEDESRHANSYFEYIQKDLKKSPDSLYKYLRAASFMLNPKAPLDTHAVTITKTIELLDDPRYIMELDGILDLEEEKVATHKRIYSLLSIICGETLNTHRELVDVVKKLKPARVKAEAQLA